MFSRSVIRRGLGLAAIVVLMQAAPAFATSDVVISQFRSQGVANGDFVDLVNRSDHTVHMASGGWRMSFLYADNYGTACYFVSNIDDNHPLPAVTLAPGQHYLITQAGWTGTGAAASDLTFTRCGDLRDTDAILTLDAGYDSTTNNPIGSDSVGYGTVAYNSSPEGANLANPPSDGRAYQRKTANGLIGSQDTDNSTNDWVTAAATPANYPSTVPKPDGTTDAPTAIVDTTASLHATVNPHGLDVTDCHFDIGQSTSYGATVPCSPTPSGLSNMAIGGSATGLQVSKTYYYRIVATTSRGTLTGSAQSFTTLAANPGPTGTTDPATNNFAKSAIVNGTVNVHGKPVSDCRFDYGKGTFSASAPCTTTPSGADAVSVSAQLNDLDPSSTYQFRLVVTTNGAPATLTGTTRQFTTSALTTTTHQLVISQFRPQGITGGDYVDLMNITNGTLHVPAGWSLFNYNATGQSTCNVVTNAPAIVLAPGQHYLITQSSWIGTPAADRTSGCTLFDGGGYLSLNLGLDSTTGTYLSPDTVYYGTYAYGSPFNPLPTNGNSLQRRTSGKQDTDVSIDDFVPVTATPQNAPGTAPAPTGSTGTPTSLLQTSATLNGTVDPKMGSVSICKFQWGDTTSYGNEINCTTPPSGADDKLVSAGLTGLTASHTYHYRLVVTTTGGTLTGSDQPFTTPDPLPVPTGGAGTSHGTGSATKVRAATATLGGSVNPHGAGVSQCYFELGPVGSSTNLPCAQGNPSGSNDVPVTALATDLSPSTTYQFRLHVIGANGNLIGDDGQFTTTAVTPTSDPVVISQFRTMGPGGDFVDLVNKSSALVAIPAGWTMYDGDGNSQCTVVSDGPAVTLAPGQHYLVADGAYTGPPVRDLAINGSCGTLRDTNSILSFGSSVGGDSVAYGVPGGGASIPEPDPIATVPSDGKALQRRDSGVRDTGSNSDDFAGVTASPRNYASDAPPATLTTDVPTLVASVRATLHGTINPAGETISGCQFQYATDAEHTTATTYPHTAACDPATQSGFGGVPVSNVLTGLAANTTYHYRLIATSSKTGALNGTDRTFTTSDVPSVVSIDDATLLGSRTATVNATINAQGDSISGCTFDYGDDNNYGSTKACSVNPSGTSPVQVSAALTGLTPSHQYHYRVRFTAAAAGAKQSADRTFSTTVLPSAATGQPGSVGTTTATLTGTINPRGESVSDCHFDYGTDTSYGQSVTCPKPSPGTLTDTPVSAALTGLDSTKGYHYRLVVTTSGSATPIVGGDQSFTTTTPPSVATTAATALRPTTMKLTGVSNPRDETVNQCVFEWGEDNTYGHTAACANNPSGNTDTPVQATISGLTANHAYHYRLVVTTAISLTKYGDDMTGTTAPAPSAATVAPDGLTATKANLRGSATMQGENVATCEFEYGTDSSSYGTTVPCSSLPANDGDAVSAAVTGLDPGTTYHARLNVKTTPSGVAHGNDFEFTTAPEPSAATIAPTGLTATKATLRGTATPHGENVTACTFDYGTDASSYGTNLPCADLPTGDGDSVAVPVTGLTPNTTYHARVNVTTTSRGLAHGNDFEFKTDPAPSVATAPAGDLTQTSATLAGTALPSGESVSDCHFEYGADTNYGASAPCDSTPSGSDPFPVAAALTGLQPGSTYHFRVVMTTALGTMRGDDATFTTPAAPSTGAGGGSGGQTPSNPDTPSGPSTPSGPATPSGPTDPTPPVGDVPLTGAQFLALLKFPGTQTVPAAGTVTLGTVTCPKVCGDVTITAFGPAGASRAAAAKTKKPPVYGTGKATVKKGKTATLSFKLNAAGKKALKKSKKLKVSVTVAVKQAGVSPVTVTKTIVLKPAKRNK